MFFDKVIYKPFPVNVNSTATRALVELLIGQFDSPLLNVFYYALL